MNWILNFIFGPKCPICNTRNLYPCESSYNLKNYWCDFCFVELVPIEDKK